MRKLGVLLLFFSCFSFSQNKQILYGFSEIPQNILLNPGTIVKNDWYFGIPLLSHFHANIGISGFSVYDLFADDGRDFNAKLQQTIYGMKNTDFFAFNQQLELFSIGFRYGKYRDKKDQYFSFGMYQETDAFIKLPRDVAILAYEGNFNNTNRVFNFGNASLKAELISTLHFGYNKRVNEKFTYGFRAKIYSSIFNLNSVKNKGSFVTVLDANNQLNNNLNLDLELQTSGIVSFTDTNTNTENDNIKEIRKRFLLGGNLGLGFDVGFTYKLSDQLIIDASLQDIGFINHKKNVRNYTLIGFFSGEEIDQFRDAITTDTTSTKYTSWRPVKLNTSLKYGFGETIEKEKCNCLKNELVYKNEIGAHLFAIKRPGQLQLALTAFIYRRLFKGLSGKATYTIDSFSYTNLGLGLSTNLRGLNFYIMADNLLVYQNLAKAQSLSLQFGFNYIFKKK